MARGQGARTGGDVFVGNEPGGFHLVSPGVVERVIDDRRANDAQFVEAHEAILMSLVGDDSFIVRVVLDESLTSAENDEWIAKVQRPLRISGGRLFACPGFNPDLL